MMEIKGSMLAQRRVRAARKIFTSSVAESLICYRFPDRKRSELPVCCGPSSHSRVQFPRNLRGISTVCAKCFGWRVVPTSHVPTPQPQRLIVELIVAVYSKFGTLITHKSAQVPGDAGKRFLHCDENHGCKYRMPQH